MGAVSTFQAKKTVWDFGGLFFFFPSTFLRTDRGKRRYIAWPSQEARCAAVTLVLAAAEHLSQSALTWSWSSNYLKIGCIIKLLFVSQIVSVILAGFSRKAETTFPTP